MQKDEFKVTSFPGLPQFGIDRTSEQRLRICIATEEIFGPVRNGGIASTYYHLARSLVADGHEVTVLYLKGTKCENETVEHWIEFYRRLDVRFVPLPAEPLELICPSPRWQRPMYELHRWLKSEEPYDIVHTSEWRGGAYYALLAKRLGLAFERTLFLVKTSSPYIWNRHYRMLPLGDKAELARMYPERRVVELADVVIGGSAHLLTFMKQKGYRLPADRTFVQPNIIDFQDLNVEEKRPPYQYGDFVRTGELVFFGRLEARKGLDIFCEAITRIAESGTEIRKVTFLGKQGERLPAYPGVTTIEFIQQQARAWPFPVEVIDSYDQDKAIGYLCASPRIAVMPSVIENSTMTVYECLMHRIPFLATSVGGTPELIAERHHHRVLIEPHPESLTAGLQRVLREGGTVAEGAFDYEGSLGVWRDFHRYLAAALAEKTVNEVVSDMEDRHRGEDGPGPRSAQANAIGPVAAAETTAQDDVQAELRVSVCIYYHQRPQFLEILLESLLAQDGEVEEVIIVNDGAPSDEVPGVLARVEERSGSLRFKVLDQPHRCIGPALNAAASEASGDLLVFMNAGHHYCEPNLVGVFRRAASESPAVAFTCFHALFENGKPGRGGNEGVRVVPLGGDLATGFYEDGVFGGSCFAVRRAAFFETGGFYEGYHIGGIEQEFHARLVIAGHDLDVVPEVLYWERRVASGIPFNTKSKEYLAIRPFLQSAPNYLENILLTARMLARKVERAEAEIARHRGEIAMHRGDWETANEHWEEMRRLFPDHASGYVRGAEALVRAVRLDEAEAVACEAVERFPDRPGGYVQRGEIATRRGDWALASERWGELRGAFPDQAAGYVRGAEALLAVGRLDEAEAVACEAVEHFRDRPGGYVQRGEIATRRGDWALASERWGELRRAFPDQAAGYVRGAEALVRAGRLDEAEAVACEAVERFPDRPGGYVQRGEIAMRRGDWALASERWGELRRAFPDQAAGYVRGAEALLAVGRLDEAEAVACEAVERFRDRPGGYVQRGEIATRRGDWALASERWGELRRAFPDQAAGYVRGAEALVRAGRLDEAEALACEAVERFCDRPGGYVQRAEIATHRKDWALASGRWGELRVVFPDHVAGYVRGTEALLNAGRLDEAEAVACEAVERFRDRPGGYVQRGEIATRRGDWALASERWGELRRAFPDQAAGYVRGTEALLNAGRLDEAEALAGEAVERFPERPQAYIQRGEAAMRRGDWALASDWWGELRRAFPDQALGYVRGAEALVSAGCLDEAEALACKMVERFSDRSEGYVQRGEIAMRRGDWALASERWGELRGAFPDQAAGYVRGAEALVRAGRLDEAEALACEAVERFCDRPGGYVQRAEIATHRKDWALASGRWGELRVVFPDHVAGYVRGAEALLNAGRLDEAEALAGEAVERFPERPQAYIQRGEAAMRRGDWALASDWWGELRRAFPDQALGYVRGAEALVSAGCLDEAEALACMMVERFSDRSEGYVQRAEIATHRKDWALASGRWGELRVVFPDHVAGYVRGAEALLNAGRLDEAEALAGEAVERFCDRSGGYVQRAEIATHRKDWALASGRWGELRVVFPDHVAGYVRGAEALLNAGRLDEAEALAGEAVERFPDHPGVHHRRAEIAMRRRDREAARGLWAVVCRALNTNPAGRSVRRLWRFRIALLRAREVLMALIAPGRRRARRIEGAVEGRRQPEVRGWLLDSTDPGRKRSVAIRVEGRLREVVVAEGRRNDIARWRGTDGYHGFLWQIPEDVAATDGARIDVADAETGMVLRGSPARIEGGRVVASEAGRR